MSTTNPLLSRDPVTGFLTMQDFYAEAEKILQEQPPTETESYTIVYTNVRNFKYYNIRYGMAQGDELLRFLAGLILEKKHILLFSRFGQDHFVLLLHGDSTIPQYLRRENSRVHRHFDAKYGSYGMQYQVGSYTLTKAEESLHTACEFAKLACDSLCNTDSYQCVYDENLDYHLELSAHILQHFEQAMNEHHIEVYLQPVVRTLTGKLCSLEALARWKDPEHGMISPGEFIPILEKNRLIMRLDLYMLHEICKIIRMRLDSGKTVLPVSFNLSRMDFLESGIVRAVDEIVREYELPPDLIHIEITETAFTGDSQRLGKQIEAFRSRGYEVWMDDFGSGYSSLNVLKDYHFDEIKLDMKFMRSFDERAKSIVRSIVDMAKRIGVQTLAEGVETEEQFFFLRDIGCEKVQGYYFGKPLPDDELSQYVAMQKYGLEPPSLASYYKAVSAVNLVTEHPRAILEWDGQKLRFLHVNKPYEKVLLGAGAHSLTEAENNMNDAASSISRIIQNLRQSCHLSDEEKTLTYTIRGRYLRVNVRCIAECGERAAFSAGIVNLTASSQEGTAAYFDKISRQMFDFFDLLFIGNLDTDEIDILRHGEYHTVPRGETIQTTKTLTELFSFSAYQIHPHDRKEFLAFSDTTTLASRAASASRPYLSRYLRVLMPDGTYKWKIHTILYLSEHNSFLYGTRFAPIDSNPAELPPSSAALPSQPNGSNRRKSADNPPAKRKQEIRLPHRQNAQEKENEDILKQFFNIYENLSEVVYMADMDTYELLYVNRKGRESYGYSSLAEVLGQKCHEFISEKSEPCPYCTNERLKNGQSYEWQIINSHVGKLFNLRDQMITLGGRHIRVEIASEVCAFTDGNEAENLQLMLSEAGRIALEATDHHQGLRDLIEHIGPILDAGYTYFFERTKKNAFACTYRWSKKGMPSYYEITQQLPFTHIAPSWQEDFQKGDFIILYDISDQQGLSPELQDALRQRNVQNLILGPIRQNEKLIGLFGIVNIAEEKIEPVGRMFKTLLHVLETLIIKRERSQLLETLSYQDNLTHLGNRHAVARLWGTCNKTNSIGILFCDICGLKMVNDTLGHLAGDKLIVQTKNLLLRAFSPDEVFRWGGDEILVITSGLSKKALEARTKRIRALAESEHVPLAIGLVWENSITDSMETLIDAADDNMYIDKQQIHASCSVLDIIRQNKTIQT